MTALAFGLVVAFLALLKILVTLVLPVLVLAVGFALVGMRRTV